MNERLRSSLRSLPWIAVPLLLGIAAYWSSLAGRFVWDDTHIVGRWMLTNSGVKEIFFPGEDSLSVSFFYKPLVAFVSWIIFEIAGKEPYWWRVASLAFHLASVPAVYILLRDWMPAPPPPVQSAWNAEPRVGAAAGAALFALWPAGAQAVTWVAARGDLQLAVCVTWGLVLHLRARDGGTTSLPAAFLFFCGWLSKEPAIAFLPAAVAATFLFPPAKNAKVQGPKAWLAPSLWLPYVAAFLGYIALRKWAVGSSGGIDDAAKLSFHGADTIRTAFFAWGFYVRELLLFGTGLPYLENVAQDRSNAMWSIGGGVLVALSCGAVFFPSRRILAFPAIWIVLFLGPALAVAHDPPTVNQVAVRYLYVPTLGLSVLAGWALSRVALPKIPALAVGVGLAAALVWSVTERSRPWMDNNVLWARAWKDDPGSLVVANNLATLALGRNDLDTAENWYRIAAWTGRYRRPEKKNHALINLANLYAGRGKLDLARFTLRVAREYEGSGMDDAMALVVEGTIGLRAGDRSPTGNVLVSRRDIHAAIATFERASEIDPLDDEAPFFLARIYEAIDEPVLARERYRQVIARNLGDPYVQENAEAEISRLDAAIAAAEGVRKAYYLAQAIELDGDLVGAAAAYRKAVELAPERTDLRLAEAELHYRAKNLDAAVAALREAKAAGVHSAQISLNLGVYEAHRGQFRPALVELVEASRLAPDWPKPLLLQAQLHESFGERDLATARYREALALPIDPVIASEVRKRLAVLAATPTPTP